VSNPLTQLSLDELRGRTSIKWQLFGPEVLPLWVAEMDVCLAEPVAAALTRAIATGDTGYPSGTPMYAEALASFAASRWGWDLQVASSALVPDVMIGIVEVLRLVTSPGDSVVVNPPVYPWFYPFIEHADRHVVEAPLGADGRLDLAVLEDVFARLRSAGGNVAYLLCSPQNPTGAVHTAAELGAVATLAERYEVRVIADEIHAPLVMPGATFVPYLSVPGGERGFSLLSASKGWNMAGLKAAVAVAGADAAADLARMPEEVGHGASHVGVIGHVAALTEGVQWLDELRDGLDANRRLLSGLLAEHLPAVGYQPGEATYLAWLDCRDLGLGDDAAAVFLERGRVALNPGPEFGTGGSGYVRMNLATSPEIITEAVHRMAAALA
jgi:cystathionine beta-lyase